MGGLQRIAGTQRQWSPAETVTVADVLQHLVDELPELEERLPQVACAVGDQLVHRRTVLDVDTHLVLLPPVAGG